MSQFEPKTIGQQAIHPIALTQFDAFLEAAVAPLQRHVRHPCSLALGALINMIFLWLLDIELGGVRLSLPDHAESTRSC
jgi:hypothetical protein